MTETVNAIQAQLDARRSAFLAFFGRKGSGKSNLAARFWETWPYDRLCVDPTGDAVVGDDVEKLEIPLPVRWPSSSKQRTSLHLIPDPGAPTYRDDLDRAVGLAFRNRRSLLWLDEIGEHSRANRTAPNMHRALHQGRHRDLSMLMCGPRPIDIDPLVISQADFVYVFALPHPRDRDRVAATIGFPPKEFAAAVDQLGEFEYLRFEAGTHELVHFPALPRGAQGTPRS